MAKQVSIRIIRHGKRHESFYFNCLRDTTVGQIYEAEYISGREAAEQFGGQDLRDRDAAGGGWVFRDDVGDEVYAYRNVHEGVTIEEVSA